jgi:hypothetical protein
MFIRGLIMKSIGNRKMKQNNSHLGEMVFPMTKEPRAVVIDNIFYRGERRLIRLK